MKSCYADKEYCFSVHANEIYNIRHKFEELSSHDALTGIYNRRYFNIVFPRELNRAKETGKNKVVLFENC